MTNKPKQIGTRAETITVRYLNANGFGGAERLALHGNDDEGDIGVCPGVMAEIKGGLTAEAASDRQVAAWLTETETERLNRGASVAFLVWKRKGKGAASAGQWWAAMPGWTYVYLARCAAGVPAHDVGFGHADLPPARMTLADVVRLLRLAGYGDALKLTDRNIA